ncbi:hypothetical protein Taro_024131, partial [Colocasia esculenta]|nr:hypothetical protein [Colocasia esculenta]
ACGGGDANALGALASPGRASAPGAPASTASRGWRGAGHDSALGAGGLAPAAAATRQQQHRAALPPLQAAEAAASPPTPPHRLSPSSLRLLLPINTPMGMASSTTQSDSDLHDQYFEDWFSDVDPELLDINSSALVEDYRQAFDLIDSSTGGTSAPVLDAQAPAGGTANSEFQVVPPLPGIDTSDSLSIHAPSPLTVSNSWSPPVVA